VLQLRDIPAECDSRSVCGDIQRVHHLAVNIWGVGPVCSRSPARKGGRRARSDAAPGKGCRQSRSGDRRSVRARASARRERCERSPPRQAAGLPSGPIRHIVRRRRQRCP
jgi:hypothetical protein